MMILAIDWLGLWNNSWPAGLAMLLLGLVFAVILLIASEKLKVKSDSRLEEIASALPGANCGACGFAGCSQYAKAVIENPQLAGKCTPGGQSAAATIAKILDMAPAGPLAPRRAIVHCRAHTGDKTYNGHYVNVESCTNAAALPSGQACTFGCLGFGDCVKSCKFDAIEIVDGLATINYDKCTGCGACVTACPRKIMSLAPFTFENMMTVGCSSKESGKVTKANCSVGCIGCGICAKLSPLFAVKDNLARVDYDNYTPTAEVDAAFTKCPTAVIIEAGTSPRANKDAQTKEPAMA